MAQISLIKKSEIEKAKRFDSEYFKPEYLEIEKKLEKIGSERLENLSEKPKYGTTPKGGIFENEGVPFLRSQDFKDLFVNLNNVKFCKKEFHKKNKKSDVIYGDILIACVGATVGEIGFYLENEEANINQNIGRIRSKNINPFYFFTYLLSNFGNSQIKRLNTGNVKEYLNSLQLEKIKIPILSDSFQLQIEKIILESKEKQNKAKENYKKAEKILLEELDLVNFEVKHTLTFTTTKSKVEKARRFDSEYFQPKYDEIIKKIENYKNGFCEIGKIVKWEKGFEVGSEEYLEKGSNFGRVSDFSINGFENISKKIDEEKYLELKEKFEPKKGEILFTKDGTIGLSYLLKENFKGILSSAFLRLKLINDFDKESLTLILNSILSRKQIEKFSGGAIINHLKPSEFEKIKIPLIDERIQNEIKFLIEESYILRKKSKELLEKAKKMVEDEIEEEYLKKIIQN